jgi:hypothetical protein
VSFASLHGARAYFLVALSAPYFLPGLTPADAAEAFKQLTAPQIRSMIVGSVVTDESHWSDRYESSGTLMGMELGRQKLGTWKLVGNEMCVTRKTRKPVEECFEIWISKDHIEYRSNGVTLTTGVLRKE